MGYVLLLALLLSGSDDWPQFRGSGSNGHAASTPFPMEWSDSVNVAWKVSIPGLGWSSPVIAGDSVFLTTAVSEGEGLSLRVLSLNTRTGKTNWDREVRRVEKAPGIHTKNSHASPTPIVRDGSVFVHFGVLGTAKLLASDGSIQWLNQNLDYPPMHGSGGTPILQEGKLVVACDGSKDPFVVALDTETGDIAWKRRRSIDANISHSFGTATIATVAGKSQVIAPGPNHLAAYDLESGKELWQVRAPGWSVVPQPALGPGLVIYNHDYDNPELIAVRLGGEGDVTDTHIAWRLKRGAPSTPSPLLVGEHLFFVSDNGLASCVNVHNGERYWMERLGGNFSASPIYANGAILFLDEDGVATWVADAETFTAVRKNEVEGRTLATPAFSEGAIYLRTDQYLYKFASP